MAEQSGPNIPSRDSGGGGIEEGSSQLTSLQQPLVSAAILESYHKCKSDPSSILNEILSAGSVDTRAGLIERLALANPSFLVDRVAELGLSQSESIRVTLVLLKRSRRLLFSNFDRFNFDTAHRADLVLTLLNSDPKSALRLVPDLAKQKLLNVEDFNESFGSALAQGKVGLALELMGAKLAALQVKITQTSLAQEFVRSASELSAYSHAPPSILKTAVILCKANILPTEEMLKVIECFPSDIQCQFANQLRGKSRFLQARLLEIYESMGSNVVEVRELAKALGALLKQSPNGATIDAVREFSDAMQKGDAALKALQWRWKKEEMQLITDPESVLIRERSSVSDRSILKVYAPKNLNQEEFYACSQTRETSRPFFDQFHFPKDGVPLVLLRYGDSEQIRSALKRSSDSLIRELSEAYEAIEPTDYSEIARKIAIGAHTPVELYQLVAYSSPGLFERLSIASHREQEFSISKFSFLAAELARGLSELAYSSRLERILSPSVLTDSASYGTRGAPIADIDPAVYGASQVLLRARDRIISELNAQGVRFLNVLAHHAVGGPSGLARGSLGLSSSDDVWSLENPSYSQIVYFDVLRCRVVGVTQLHEIPNLGATSDMLVRLNPSSRLLSEFGPAELATKFMMPVLKLVEKSECNLFLPEQTASHLLSNLEPIAEFLQGYMHDARDADVQLTESLIARRMYRFSFRKVLGSRFV